MSQSRSLTSALKAAEQVLTATTDDLAELAEIAASETGFPVDRILMSIDLTDLDLRGRDISYLLDKQPHYQRATLSTVQRRQFERAERDGARRRIRRKIRTLRVSAIVAFIDWYTEGDVQLQSELGQSLTAEHLRGVLLEPIRQRYFGDMPLDAAYTAHVLDALAPWAATRNERFYISFFELLSKLQSPADDGVANILNEKYLPAFGRTLGYLIAEMQPTSVLDRYWVVDVDESPILKKTKPYGYSPRDYSNYDSSVGSGSYTVRAQQISSGRPLHPSAVEAALDHLSGISDQLSFLERVRFECNVNEGERIAARITNSKWRASETIIILEAKVHPRVRGALFRQLLQQGNESRIIEILRWLNAGRGAVGALSLDDAFRNIGNFSAGLRFAEEAGRSFADNQLNVVYFALRNLARTSSERASLEALRKRLNYEPPSIVPPQVLRSIERDVDAGRLAEAFSSEMLDGAYPRDDR